MPKPIIKTVDDVFDYCDSDDCLIIRNTEGEVDKHWIENYDKGNPEIIDITEELYMDCFTSEKFQHPSDFPNEDDQFYLRSNKF